MNRRLDIYLNGEFGLKAWAIGLLLAPRRVGEPLLDAGRALADLLCAVLGIAFALCGPMLFWLAPVLALFTARRTHADDEVRERMRQGIHQNGRGQ
jgi:hypothetical protein